MISRYLVLALTVLVSLPILPATAAKPSSSVRDCFKEKLEKKLTEVSVLPAREFFTEEVRKDLAQIEGYEKSALKELLDHFGSSEKLEHAILQFHLADWMRALNLNAPEQMAGLRDLWAGMKTETKRKYIQSLLKIFDDSTLAKAFSDPAKLGEDLALVQKLGMTSLEVQGFVQIWERASKEERETFLLLTLVDELPGALNFLLPYDARGTAITPALMTRVPVKYLTKRSLWRKGSPEESETLMVLKGLEEVGRAMKDENISTYKERVEHFLSTIPPKSLSWSDIHFVIRESDNVRSGWMASEHRFKKFSKEYAKEQADSFAVKDENGVGRMRTRTSIILTAIEKINQPLTREQRAILYEAIPNSRERDELEYRLAQLFPATGLTTGQ